MFRYALSSLVGVSAALAIASSVTGAPVSKLAPGSKVFIAPMAGLDTYFRAATTAIDVPLVFVRTKGEADFVVTGATKEVPRDQKLDAEDAARSVRTTRLHSTVEVANIKSGEIVFRHSVRTLVHSPIDSASPHRATGDRTSSSLLADGRETAARRCAQALKDAMTP